MSERRTETGIGYPDDRSDEAMQPPHDAAWRSLRERIDPELSRTIGGWVDQLRGLHPDLAPLADELGHAVLGGGKRLRPLLVLVGHELGGGEDPDDVIGPALAVELVHTCALVHDDVIDRSPRRRGRPAAHISLAEVRGRSPEADHFGTAAAILLGDLAHVIADDLFLDATVDDPARLLDAFATFTRMRTEVTAGQYLDIAAAGRDEVDAELALTIAGYKSGRYSVARPLEIGATLAGAPEVAALLGDVGVGLGQAFQLRDDVLGVFGSESETGKSTSSDLAEGKRTYLVARTLESLEGADRERFLVGLGDPTLDEDGAAQLRELIRTSGGLDATERRIDELVGTGIARLEEADLPTQGAETLVRLARYLVDRHR